MEEDKEPLMMEKPSNEEEEAKSFENLEIEAKEGCCNRNLAFMISLMLLLSFMVVWEAIHIYILFNNDYFDEVYYILYLILVLFLFLLLIFLFIMSC